MAQVVQILLTDDITGDTADETVSFALDGQAYEIDLTAKSADELRKNLSKYQEVARLVSQPARGRVVRSSSAPRRGKPAVGTTEARTWLKANGHPDLKDRGRIPASLIAEYEARDQGLTPVPDTPATVRNDIKE